jgi:antitoxin CcdA
MRMLCVEHPMPSTAPRPKKKAVNVSIDAALAAEAKAAGVNISAVLEIALAAQLKSRREAQWRDENRAAIESMNAYVEIHGLPLAKFRTW